MLGKIEGKRRRGQKRMKWWDGITNSMDITRKRQVNQKTLLDMCLRFSLLYFIYIHVIHL